MKRWIVAPMMVVLLIGLASAQECKRAISVQFNNPNNRIVPLSKEHIRLKVGGTQPVIEKLLPLNSVRLVIVFDIHDKAEEIASALFASAGHLLPQHSKIAVVVPDEKPVVVHPLSEDFPAIKEAVVAYAAHKVKQVRFWDGVAAAVDLLSEPQLGDAIIIVTNAASHATESSPKRVVARAQRYGIAIYAAGVVSREPNFEAEKEGPFALNDVTEPTGGRTFISYGSDFRSKTYAIDAEDFLSPLFVQLSSRQVLMFSSAALSGDRVAVETPGVSLIRAFYDHVLPVCLPTDVAPENLD
jgi:hypothetical protein